jgi:CrcB protein
MRYEWQHLLVVGIGGFVGAILRFVVTGLPEKLILAKYGRLLPVGTFLANALGCALIGVLMAFVATGKLSQTSRLLLVTGLLGSLTTFSTFGWETVELFRESQVRLALLNVAANVLLGITAAWGGFVLTRTLIA